MNTNSTKTPKVSKQLLQNNLERQIEKALDQKILEFFETRPDLELDKIHTYHISKSLKGGLKTQHYNRSNGFTLLVVLFKNADPLFQVAVCSDNDTYSRLLGRVTVKERVVNNLKEKGLNAFLSYPLSENTYKIPTYRYIANRYINENLKRSVKPILKNPLPLTNVSEKELLDLAINQISLVNGLKVVKDSVDISVHHIRLVNYKGTALLGTLPFFKSKRVFGELYSNGGLTLVSLKFTLQGQEDRLAAVTWASCSTEDVYSKSYGRKQGLKNIIEQRVHYFRINDLADYRQYDEYALNFLETNVKYPINLDPALAETIEVPLKEVE